MQEMVEKFDVRDVKANPAHFFDLDKAISINAEHIRMLDADDFLRRFRAVPAPRRRGVRRLVGCADPTVEREVLTAAAPLVQPRVRLLGEVSGMAGSLLSTEGYIEPDADARKQLKDSAGDVLDKAIAALRGVDEADWKAEPLHALLDKALVEEGGYKPRLAYGAGACGDVGPPRVPAAVRVDGDRRQGCVARPPGGFARTPVTGLGPTAVGAVGPVYPAWSHRNR